MIRAAAALVASVAFASGAAEEKRYEPFDKDNFDDPTRIDSEWYPMVPGTRFTWEGSSVLGDAKRAHRVVFTVTDLTKVVDGVNTVVCWDQDFVDGVLEETEIVFFAQDNDGAIWSLGEYPEEYRDGIFVEAPFWIHNLVDGKAGILIPGKAEVGTPSFAQGWSPSMGFTDRGQVHKLGEKVVVPFGTYDDVLVIEEWDKVEPDARAYKYYARGVGHVKVMSNASDKELLELVSIEKLDEAELAKAREAALQLEENARDLAPESYGTTAEPVRATAAAEPPVQPPAKQAPSPGDPGIPGSEEFGLTPRQLVEAIETAEADIARCMREQGFEYVAVPYRTIRRGMNADKRLPGLTEGEFVAKYGFGIATLYTGQPPQLSTGYSPAKMGLGRRNIGIYMNLSPADRVAYDRALFGENTGATLAVAIESENLWRTGGCTRRAVELAFDPDQLKTSYINPKDTLIYSDPRMKAAIREYSAGMRTAGFEYNHPDEVEAEILKRLDAITGGRSIPLEALSPDGQHALTELQDFERRVADASYQLEMKLFEPIEERLEFELFGRPDPMP